MSNLYTNNSSIKGYSGSISINKTKDHLGMDFGLTLKTMNSIQMI